MSYTDNVIDWNPGTDYDSQFTKRYAHLELITGVEELDASYSFDYVGIFYDPIADGYMVGTTSGCSCPSPWDDQISEMSPYMGKDAAVKEFRRTLDANGYRRWGAGHVLDAVDALRRHEGKQASDES